jgi:hypothetical protein
MVKAKVLMCGLGMLWLWGITLTGAFLWALCMGRIDEMAERLVSLTGSSLAASGALAGGLALLMVISWVGVVGRLWMGLLGRQIGQSPAPLILVLTVCFWFGIGYLVINDHEEGRFWLGWVLVMLLLAKGLGTTWVIGHLRKRQLVSRSILAILFAGWTLLTMVTAGIAWWLFPWGILAAGIVVVAMPLGECLAAPLALALNRNR